MVEEERLAPGSGAPPGRKEGPGADWAARGAEGSTKKAPREYDATAFAASENRAPRRRKSGFAASAPPRLKRAARAVGYAAALDDADAWAGCAQVLAVRLTPRELAGLGWAALRAMPPEQALRVAELVIGEPAMPLPPLSDPAPDAAIWAAGASPREVEAVVMAGFAALPPARREAMMRVARSAA